MTLTRAELIIIPSNVDETGANVIKIPLHLNPKKIDVSRGLKVERAPNAGSNKQDGRVASIEPIKLKLDSLLFDTYQTRRSVRREVIDKLESAICRGAANQGIYSLVRFNWGRFTDSKHNDEYQFLLRGFDCSYQMFLPDGTPVRALVTLQLEQFTDTSTASAQGSASAGAEAQLHTVRKGETAQSMAAQLLGDPRKWRALCDANGVDDPANIPPGTQLLVPPARMSA